VIRIATDKRTLQTYACKSVQKSDYLKRSLEWLPKQELQMIYHLAGEALGMATER
jgi:hypothetical protein